MKTSVIIDMPNYIIVISIIKKNKKLEVKLLIRKLEVKNIATKEMPFTLRMKNREGFSRP